ncbi:integrase [Lelliottia sp. RWM.1]|uniref:integrase n=1 Tax=Lelliottia sp. RWM.1 TaxID=2663242 RepID=UPI00193DD47D|nr:integrase [Lelliottia sp. RWM.1]MBM3072331.1 integrase [Lelliottia sp. RWM.1]
MYFVDNNSAVPVMPAPGPVVSTTPTFFTEGGGGVPPTYPGPDWFNIIQSELLNFLIKAGIDPEKTDHTQLYAAMKKLFLIRTHPFSDIKADGADAVQEALSNLGLGDVISMTKYGCPLIGELVDWPLALMPHEIWPDMKMEFIPYMGQTFDAVKYPLLAQLHPTLQLPTDMRGKFARGWDNGRGIDSGRSLLSNQDDAIQNIVGAVANVWTQDPNTASGVLSYSGTGSQPLQGGTGATIPFRNLNINAAAQVRTAPEVRVKNVAWNQIVRAK